jgi:hypothetical protein
MKAPLEAFPDSPNNQHHLQLLLNRHLFETTYPGIEVKECFIVYVSHTTVCWVSLNSQLAAISTEIINAVQQTPDSKEEKDEEQEQEQHTSTKSAHQTRVAQDIAASKHKKPHRVRDDIVARVKVEMGEKNK